MQILEYRSGEFRHGRRQPGDRPAGPRNNAIRARRGVAWHLVLISPSPGSVTHEGHPCFGGEVNEGLSADVYRRARDRAAGEAPRCLARVVVGDWFCAVFPDVEALAGDRELAGLRLDPALSYLFLACVQGQGALGWHGVAVALEGGRDDHVARGQQFGGLDDLLDVSDEVIYVLELAVLDVEGVAAEPGPVREQDTLGILGVEGDLDRDGVGAVTDARRDRLGDLSGAGVIDVPVPWLGQLGPVGGEDLNDVAVLQRQGAVLAGLRPTTAG